ncbi:hypothetical protein KI387_039372, partial [Taxus chinensis]
AGLGVKETVPPYLDPKLSTQDLLTGVSFATSGAGYDNLTAAFVNVYPMLKQLDLFKNYKARLENTVGVENSSGLIGEAIFMAVAGTDDFMLNYYQLPIRREQFSVAQYIDFVLQICSNFIEEMYEVGARKLGLVGVPPMGCLPLPTTLAQPISEKELRLKEYNQVAVSYNMKLKALIKKLQARLSGIKLAYIDIYESLFDIINYPSKYGSAKCQSELKIEFGYAFCDAKAAPNPVGSSHGDGSHPTPLQKTRSPYADHFAANGVCNSGRAVGGGSPLQPMNRSSSVDLHTKLTMTDCPDTRVHVLNNNPHRSTTFKDILQGRGLAQGMSPITPLTPAVTNPNVSFGDEVLDLERFYLEHALIGRFSGLWPNLATLHDWITKHWIPILSGKLDLYPCAKGTFIVVFSSIRDKEVIDNKKYVANRMQSRGLFFWKNEEGHRSEG